MSRGTRYVLLLVAPTLVLAGCMMFGKGNAVSGTVGKAAPDFELTTPDGKPVRLADLHGRPVVVAFFAYGCPPCRAEAPHLSQLAETYSSDGLTVLGVNAWDEPPARVAQFATDAKLKHTLLVNGSGVAEKYQVQAVPVVFWIDGEGMIVDVEEGAAGLTTLDRKTRRLLKK